MHDATRLAVINYNMTISRKKGKEILETWEEVRRKRNIVLNDQIEEELYWIIDTGNTRTHMTVCHNTLETTSHIKNLVWKMQAEAEEERTRGHMES